MNSADNINNKEQDGQTPWGKFKSLFQSSPKTTEDMVAIVDAATENEVIDRDAKRIIEGALEVSEMQTREIMIPRTQMVVLKATDSFTENLNKIISSGHSRYPVIGETVDDILGILLSKDLLGIIADMNLDDHNIQSKIEEEQNNNKAPESGKKLNRRASITDLLRPAVFVPESKRLNVLLKQFREDRNHMALVIDEYGSLAGLITIEDVLEEIVGEIEDEHDSAENIHIRKVSNLHYIIDALTTIDEFNNAFNVNFEDDEFDTIGGIVTNKFGHLPTRNEAISFNGFTFHVMQADSKRVRMLRMSIDESNTDSNTDQ